MTGFITSIFCCHVFLPPQWFTAARFKWDHRCRSLAPFPVCSSASGLLPFSPAHSSQYTHGIHTQHCWPISRKLEGKLDTCTWNSCRFHYYQLVPKIEFTFQIPLTCITLSWGALCFQQGSENSQHHVLHTKSKEGGLGLRNLGREDISKLCGIRHQVSHLLPVQAY